MRDMTTKQGSTDRLTATVKLGERDIEVYEPQGEQLYVLAQVRRMVGGESETAFRALGIFGGVIDALMVDTDDQDWAYNELTIGRLALDHFLEIVKEIISVFSIELPDDDAPRRPAGRAQAITRRPARRK